MGKLTHKQAYADRKYLWKYAEADDMTGGYVESEDMEKLLKSPTAATAIECISSQICHWFSAGPDITVLKITGGVNLKAAIQGMNGQEVAQYLCDIDERVEAIRQRHGGEIYIA